VKYVITELGYFVLSISIVRNAIGKYMINMLSRRGFISLTCFCWKVI